MNNQRPSISSGIVQSISKFREEHVFEDFKVKVGEDIHTCHSFILASCSEFFNCLLRTDMKEKQEMTVELKNISSPIFKIILNSLYTGCELLTKENVLEVWSAVHQLQIHFLIEHCEDFIVANLSLDTVEVYKQHAALVNSEKVRQSIIDFLCTNFEKLKTTETMLRMNFQDFIEIIQSDKLNVSSEDEVLYSIFDWINYGELLSSTCDAIENVTLNEKSDTSKSFVLNISSPETCLGIPSNDSQESTQSTDTNKENELPAMYKIDLSERKKCLASLIKATRYSLASHFCITHLYEESLTQNDTIVKDIFFKALSFKMSVGLYSQGFCPTSAIHRDCSKFRHAGVYCNRDKVRALCFKENKWITLNSLPSIKDFSTRYYNLTVCNGELYALLRDLHNKMHIIEFINNSWKCIKAVNVYRHSLFVSNDKYIYCIKDCNIERVNPCDESYTTESCVSYNSTPQYALSFYNNILLFSSKDNLENETEVFFYNTDTGTSNTLDSIQFSAKNMTSFRDDINTYILDVYGNLWKLTNSRVVRLIFVAKLWNKKYDIKGVVLFRKTLFVFTGSPNDIDVVNTVEDIFTSTKIREIADGDSNVVQYLISK